MAKREGSSLALYGFLDILREQCSGGDGEIRKWVLRFLATERDTTASLMSCTWYCLVRNPHVFAKLGSEILSSYGPRTNGASVRITFSSLKECTSLQHALSKTLRLHSVVHISSCRALWNSTLPTGGGADGKSPMFVPQGTEINFSKHVLHRRKDFWGGDTDNFVPKRGEKKRGDASAA
ncbi:uncharacterized protein FFB14_03220 [Fusarium fujikuroi]|nr:uncharacterized protein FFB14_03220 [Fusarium fujikuroi]